VEIGDILSDWRFKDNPWFKGADRWIKGYVAQPIFLSSSPAAAGESSASTNARVVVGVLAVVDDKPLAPLTEHLIACLKSCAEMSARDIQTNFDNLRRDRELAMKGAVSSFLNDTLVLPSITRHGSTSTLNSPSIAASEKPLKDDTRRIHKTPRSEGDFASDSLKIIQNLLDAESAVILDISDVVLWDTPSTDTTQKSKITLVGKSSSPAGLR